MSDDRPDSWTEEFDSGAPPVPQSPAPVVATGPILPAAPACILLVMEDLFFRKLIRRHLEAAGHDVVEAISSSRAFQRLRDDSPDMVLLDTWIDRGTGLQILESMRTTDGLKDLPVLLVGNDSRPAVQERAAALGAMGSVPFSDAAALARWVDEALG